MARQQQCLHLWSVVVMDYGSSTAVFTCMVSDGNGLLVNSNVYMYGQ